MSPRELSWELRKGHGEYLTQRRGIAALALVGCAAMGVITLYQMGIIPTLPDPPLPHVDSAQVDASPEAYARLDAPDAPIALVSYAVTLLLAAMGGTRRARHKPWLPLALAGKIAFDTYFAARLTISQWTRQHKTFCVYCLTAAASTFATAPLAVPETVAALRALRGQLGRIGAQSAQTGRYRRSA